MKGGDISTHRNGLPMEDSSAILNTSIWYAVIAEELLRFNYATERAVTQKGIRGERQKTVNFPSLINQVGCHPLPSAQSSNWAAYKRPNFSFPNDLSEKAPQLTLNV